MSLKALNGKEFGHPSEEIFANLLDFYRIAWEYEPRVPSDKLADTLR